MLSPIVPRTWIPRHKAPTLDIQVLAKALRASLPKSSWVSAAQGTTLFDGITSFKGIKVEKHHLYANRKVLKALLEVNTTGVFNKSLIAQALESLDVSGAITHACGATWAMDHGWYILKCMSYLRKKHREFSPKMESWMQELVLAMKACKVNFDTHEGSEEPATPTTPTSGTLSRALSSQTLSPTIVKRSLFRRWSEVSADELELGEGAGAAGVQSSLAAVCHDQVCIPSVRTTRMRLERGCLQDAGQPTCIVPFDAKKFMYNVVGDYATMIHHGNHSTSSTFVTTLDNTRIYLWPCGTTWTCTKDDLPAGDKDEDEGASDQDEDDGANDEEEKAGAGDGEPGDSARDAEEEADEGDCDDGGSAGKGKKVKVVKKIQKADIKQVVLKKPVSIMKKPCQNQGWDGTRKKYKCTARHREHSKKYHQEYNRLSRQGVGVEAAKQMAAAAAKQHVEALYG